MLRTRLALLPFVLTLPLAAQGLLITPQPPGPGPVTVPQPGVVAPPRHLMPARVSVVRTAVRADIVDGVASTTIEQTFRNEGDRDAEGTWFLPLPAGAVADGFKMVVGGKEIAGEVLDSNQARGVYEQIVRQRKDPGLLEYAGEGLLRARIYPIPARGEVGVSVRLRQVLQPTGSLYEWRWPLRAAQFGDAGDGPLVLEVKITSQTPLSTVIAPYTTAEVRRTGQHEAIVTMEGKNQQLEDLKVLYGLTEQEFGLHLLPWRDAVDPGYFAMLVSPPRDLGKDKAPRRFVQFVIDTSGSMAGAKIEQAKAAVRTFLSSLRPEDLFQVVTFASSVQPFFEAPQRATPENLAVAQQRIVQLQALGGTNIGDALQRALEAPLPAADTDGGWLSQIVFVTDGQPTVGLTNPQQILDLTKVADRQSMRIFALGVGDEIDVRLIDDLVLQHRGARDFVRNQEKIEVKVDALCQKISQPALTDVEVRCDGLDAFHVHPTRTRDLFCGEMLQVVGRYRDSGKRTVRVSGKQNGVQKEFVFQVDFPALAEKHAFVPTLWARQHVASLLDEIRRNGNKPELVDEVKRLATRYGIVTPYTSQLIVEEGMRLAGREGAFDSNQWNSAVGAGRDGRWGDLGARAGRAGSGPTTPGASGPTTGGPAGPATRGAATEAKPAEEAKAAGPGAPAAPATSALARFGSTRTGSEAVEESLATGGDDFYLGKTKNGELKDGEGKGGAGRAGLVRRAAGRVFVVIGQELVEQGLPTDWQKTAVVVEAFSDAYFELLKQNPKLRDVLALGERIVFRDGERIVRVQPAAVKPPAPAEPQAPAGK